MSTKKEKAKLETLKAFCPKCGHHFDIARGTQSIYCPCCTVLLFFDKEASRNG